MGGNRSVLSQTNAPFVKSTRARSFEGTMSGGADQLQNRLAVALELDRPDALDGFEGVQRLRLFGGDLPQTFVGQHEVSRAVFTLGGLAPPRFQALVQRRVDGLRGRGFDRRFGPKICGRSYGRVRWGRHCRGRDVDAARGWTY